MIQKGNRITFPVSSNNHWKALSVFIKWPSGLLDLIVFSENVKILEEGFSSIFRVHIEAGDSMFLQNIFFHRL